MCNACWETGAQGQCPFMLASFAANTGYNYFKQCSQQNMLLIWLNQCGITANKQTTICVWSLSEEKKNNELCWLPTCFLRLRFLVLELTMVLIIVYRYVRSIRAVLCSMTDIYSGCPFAGTFLHLTLAQVTKCAQPVDEGSWDICTAQSPPAFGGARERRAVFSASRCKAWKLPSQGHRKLSHNHPRWAVSVVVSV